MRELKFRAWDKDKKQLLLVSDISFGDDGRALTIVFQTSPKGKYYRGLVHGENGYLMQYTDFKDKHGADIYDGDILLLTCLGWGETYTTVALVTDRDGAWWMHTPQEQLKMQPLARKWEPECEIIGNIYENSELLRKVEV